VPLREPSPLLSLLRLLCTALHSHSFKFALYDVAAAEVRSRAASIASSTSSPGTAHPPAGEATAAAVTDSDLVASANVTLLTLLAPFISGMLGISLRALCVLADAEASGHVLGLKELFLGSEPEHAGDACQSAGTAPCPTNATDPRTARWLEDLLADVLNPPPQKQPSSAPGTAPTTTSDATSTSAAVTAADGAAQDADSAVAAAGAASVVPAAGYGGAMLQRRYTASSLMASPYSSPRITPAAPSDTAASTLDLGAPATAQSATAPAGTAAPACAAPAAAPMGRCVAVCGPAVDGIALAHTLGQAQQLHSLLNSLQSHHASSSTGGLGAAAADAEPDLAVPVPQSLRDAAAVLRGAIAQPRLLSWTSLFARGGIGLPLRLRFPLVRADRSRGAGASALGHSVAPDAAMEVVVEDTLARIERSLLTVTPDGALTLPQHLIS
jgi:hypothetical protein